MELLKTKISFLGIVFFILALMSGLYFKSTKYERYLIYFKNKITKKINTETRYLIKQENMEEERFVCELLLGAENHDYYSVSQGLQPKSVFVRKNVLYVDLPETLLGQMPEGFEFEEFYGLFLKNVFTNFSHIEKVNMFLDGKLVYEDFDTH